MIDKQDGCYIYQDLKLSSFTCQEQKGQFDDEEKTVLPENLFINLLDIKLQERILNGKEIVLDIKNAMETLLEEGPKNLQNNLHNWKIEEIDGRRTIFYKGKNYTPRDQELQQDIVRCTTITKWQDTQENWKHITESDKTIGGHDYECL
jgi:hypothetical protein